MFLDEMLELFKGQLTLDDVKHGLTYKEAITLRKVRIERLKKEKEELERERAAENEKAKREQARNKILSGRK
jgi:F0F1-type ATP synthase epsilon subunit